MRTAPKLFLMLFAVLQVQCIAFPAAFAKEAASASESKAGAAEKERRVSAVEQQLRDLVKYRRTKNGWLGDGTVPEGTKVIKDIVYLQDATSASQKLDLYLPQASEPLPLVIWIHGGGWSSGDKKGGPFRALLEAGFAVASLNYRLSGEAKWPAQLNDCLVATTFLKSKAGDYGIDPGRIGLWGASAGAHLALMEAINLSKPGSDASNNPIEAVSIKAVCDWFGPCDLESYLKSKDALKPGIEMIRALFSSSANEELLEKAREASPSAGLQAGLNLPPLLILHGSRDRLVPISQSKNFLAKLRQMGNKNAQLKVVKGGHGFPGFAADSIDYSIEFFRSKLSSKGKS